MLRRVPAAWLHPGQAGHQLLQSTEEATAVQGAVPQAAHDAVVAFKVGLVVGAMSLAADQESRVLGGAEKGIDAVAAGLAMAAGVRLLGLGMCRT